MGRGEREMARGVGRARAASWVWRETREIVNRWHGKLAFTVAFPMFSASVGALSEVCCGREHVFEH